MSMLDPNDAHSSAIFRGWCAGIGSKEPDVTDTEPRRVAIVDDDLAVRESLRFLLDVHGHPVETFASAADFLKADMQHLACLVLDHHMPYMTGLELVERLRAEGVGIPILLITGVSSPAIVARYAKLGIERVLEKPPSEQDLLDFVEAARS
jgi:two-component system, LuxR family, response regulator FixJ